MWLVRIHFWSRNERDEYLEYIESEFMEGDDYKLERTNRHNYINIQMNTTDVFQVMMPELTENYILAGLKVELLEAPVNEETSSDN